LRPNTKYRRIDSSRIDPRIDHFTAHYLSNAVSAVADHNIPEKRSAEKVRQSLAAFFRPTDRRMVLMKD